MTRTVCSESVEVIDNEICVYSYSQKVVPTTAKTVTVPFARECNTQMVTVCQPTPGYGYHQYGHNYCKEVAQETCYNVPVVTEDIQDVEVAFPEPIEECVQKPNDLIRISCEVLTEEKCIIILEIRDNIEPRRNTSPSPRSGTTSSWRRSASHSWLLPPARLLSSPCSSRSARRSTTDTPRTSTRSSLSPTPLPLPTMLNTRESVE